MRFRRLVRIKVGSSLAGRRATRSLRSAPRPQLIWMAPGLVTPRVWVLIRSWVLGVSGRCMVITLLRDSRPARVGRSVVQPGCGDGVEGQPLHSQAGAQGRRLLPD